MNIMQKAFKLYTSTSCKTTLATAHTQSIKSDGKIFAQGML